MNKCPHCKSTISTLTIAGAKGQVLGGKTWNCITLCCPSCGAVLSTQIDPIAVMNDTIDEVVKRLR